MPAAGVVPQSEGMTASRASRSSASSASESSGGKLQVGAAGHQQRTRGDRPHCPVVTGTGSGPDAERLSGRDLRHQVRRIGAQHTMFHVQPTRKEVSRNEKCACNGVARPLRRFVVLTLDRALPQRHDRRRSRRRSGTHA
jgi:hypothetical protein